MEFTFVWDSRGLNPLVDKGVERAIVRTLRMAGHTAAARMKAETVRQVRATRRIKVAEVNKATPLLPLGTVRDLNDLVWKMPVSGKATRAIAFPHRKFVGKKGGRGGLSIAFRKSGARSFVQGAFVATVGKHTGIFWRKGKDRFPIQEIFGPRISDIVGKNPNMKERIMFVAQTVFGREFHRLWPINLKKVAG